jgi:outer membrane receptor for ferrienterochelin and colicin
MLRTLRLALLSCALAACTHASQGGKSAAENLITEEEVDASGGVTALEVIQKVRGNFLTNRGKTTLIGSSPSFPSVFIDGVSFGEIGALRNISARQVSTIRLYRAWEAQQRYGNGYVGGVIEVTTRK